MPTRVHFDNTIVRDWTVIELEAEDRVGLLYDLSRTLGDLDLDIRFARITTEKGAAVDTFYVSEADGKQVAAGARQREIEQRLTATLARTRPR